MLTSVRYTSQEGQAPVIIKQADVGRKIRNETKSDTTASLTKSEAVRPTDLKVKNVMTKADKVKSPMSTLKKWASTVYVIII